MCIYAYAVYAASEALCFCVVRRRFCLVSCPSRPVPCQIYLFPFARIHNGFRWNSWEVINTTNILNEIGTGTREQDATENSNRHHSLLCSFKRVETVQHTGVSDGSPVGFTGVLGRLMRVSRHRSTVLTVASVSCTKIRRIVKSPVDVPQSVSLPPNIWEFQIKQKNTSHSSPMPYLTISSLVSFSVMTVHNDDV